MWPNQVYSFFCVSVELLIYSFSMQHGKKSKETFISSSQQLDPVERDSQEVMIVKFDERKKRQ